MIVSQIMIWCIQMTNLEFLKYLEKEKLIILDDSFKSLYYDVGIRVWDTNLQNQEIFLFDEEGNVIE